jgi:pentatricopeptide repeat protein
MPNVVSYDAAISACGKGAQPEQALQLLQEIPQCGQQSTGILGNAAISACEILCGGATAGVGISAFDAGAAV